MQFTILDHNWTHVSDPTKELRQLLSYTKRDYNPRLRKWSAQQVSLIDENSLFLTGLVPFIFASLPLSNDVISEDRRVYPGIEFKLPELQFSLREYQINYVINALQLGRAILDVATGGGKTILMAALMDILRQDTIVIVPNKTLEGQLITELDKILPRQRDYEIHISIARNYHNNWDQAMLSQYPVLMYDECHTAAAQQAMEVILRQNAPYRFGFSGTPEGRSDNRDLVVQGLFGQIIKLTNPEELMSQGYLAKTKVDMFYSGWDGDWAYMEEALIAHNEKRNKQIAKLATECSRTEGPVLILVRRVDHGIKLIDMIPKSVFIDGSTPVDERERFRQMVKDGKIRVLIASNVFAAGLDIPNLAVGINAGGGKGEILTGQKAGRVMRPWENIAKRWIDFYDGWCPTLERHAKLRYKIYKGAGLPVDTINLPESKERSLNDDGS